MTGAISYLGQKVGKIWLSFTEQMQLLQSRNLIIDDKEACERFLNNVNYYRFEGYFRYWQISPTTGDNTFHANTSFEEIKAVFDAEQNLSIVLEAALRKLESLFRTQFANAYGNLVGVDTGYLQNEGFSIHPTLAATDQINVSALIKRDLDRSKETFILERKSEEFGNYANLPIWAAVEVFSFGTLSKAIAASEESKVVERIAQSLNIRGSYLNGQLKALVHLRNRLAHGGKIWNHVMIDKPGLLPKIGRQYKRRYGNFADNSVFKVVCLVDFLLEKAEIEVDWLEKHVWPILDQNLILQKGIMNPQKYGDFVI